MKKLICIIFLVLSACSANAQDSARDSIRKETYSSNFLGKWNWSQGNNKFTLELEKAELSNGIIGVFGHYISVINGKKEIDTHSDPGTMMVMGDIPKPSGDLILGIYDKLADKMGLSTLTLQGHSKLKWELRNPETEQNKLKKDKPFSIPTHMVLSR